MSKTISIRMPRHLNITLLMIFGSCVCLLLQLYALPRELSRLVSLSNRCYLLLWYVCGGYMIFRQLFKPIPSRVSVGLLLLVFVAAAFINACIDSPGSALSNVVPMINFLVFPIMVMYSAYYGVDDRAKHMVYWTAVCASLIFIQLYFSDYRNLGRGYYGIWYGENVTLGYANPNQTAMYLFICTILLVSGFFFYSRPLLRLLFGIDTLIVWGMLFGTSSRTAMLMSIIFVALVTWSLVHKTHIVWVDIALIAPAAYLLLSRGLFFLLEDVTLWGEPLFTGREAIFDRYFSSLSIPNFFFGNLNVFRFENLHNGYMAIWASSGILALLAYIFFIRRNILQCYRPSTFQRHETSAWIGFLCIIMYISSEAAFFVGGANYAFLMFAVFLLFVKPHEANKM